MSLFNEPISIVGVSFDNRQESIRELKKTREKVKIVAEPTNKYDKNAVRVETDKGVSLGYIPKQIASHIHTKYTKPAYVDYSIYGGAGGKYYGMSIIIK